MLQLLKQAIMAVCGGSDNKNKSNNNNIPKRVVGAGGTDTRHISPLQSQRPLSAVRGTMRDSDNDSDGALGRGRSGARSISAYSSSSAAAAAAAAVATSTYGYGEETAIPEVLMSEMRRFVWVREERERAARTEARHRRGWNMCDARRTRRWRRRSGGGESATATGGGGGGGAASCSWWGNTQET